MDRGEEEVNDNQPLAQRRFDLPSSSTSSIISCSSSGVGFWPNILITFPSSLVLMQPSSASCTKMSKAALNSAKPHSSSAACPGYVLAQRKEVLSSSEQDTGPILGGFYSWSLSLSGPSPGGAASPLIVPTHVHQCVFVAGVEEEVRGQDEIDAGYSQQTMKGGQKRRADLWSQSRGRRKKRTQEPQ
ncbi:hypothetical protein FQN60_001801 [Etheostoma spectabile]|uniref:Uncharacterized protein n=1 Tax=Etheostoma spectabile TaxID=54343 RepID=A0A5J5D805_9PERO|nr:hypothetical protein FQN60_001801 [Etheostoma spectabile]